MNVAAVVLLGATALAGGVIWLLVDRRTLGTTTVVALTAIPTMLLGVAALCGLRGGTGGAVLLDVAAAVAVAAAVSTGGVVATAMLRIADHRTRTDRLVRAAHPTRHATDDHDGGDPVLLGADNAAGTADDEVADASDPRTLRGGATIGAMERVAVVATLLAGWPEGLALVLGIKGLGRFPELNRPPASERFIIGTLGSVLWAAAVAGVVYTLRS